MDIKYSNETTCPMRSIDFDVTIRLSSAIIQTMCIILGRARQIQNPIFGDYIFANCENIG